MNLDNITVIIGVIITILINLYQFFKLLSKIDNKVDLTTFQEYKFKVDQLTKERNEDHNNIQTILSKIENVNLQLNNILLQYQYLTEMLIEVKKELNNHR